MGEKHAELLSQYRGVASVAEAIFSDGKKQPGAGDRKDLSKGHQSVEDAVAAINRAMTLS